jgi:hypothetical protein
MITKTRPFKELPRGKVSYSPMERQLFDYLSRGKRMSSTMLIERFYKDNAGDYFYARPTINSALSSLKDKLKFNKAPIKLQSSALSGPHPKIWWLEHT